MAAPVSIYQGAPATAFAQMNDLAGGTNVIYAGSARSIQPRAVSLTVASVSTANPAVVTVTAHGLSSDNAVVIAGGTGDWTGLNGTRAITVTGANTFTVAVDTSAYAAAFAGTITTQAPQTGAAIWSIQKFYYDGSGNVLRSGWAAGSPAENQIWDNRASLSYQ